MSNEDEAKPGAEILAGPGLIQEPAAVAETLDAKLKEMVGELERVANCPSPTFDLPQDLPPAQRMERFCDALAGMGAPLFQELAGQFTRICRDQRFAPRGELALFDQRGQALVEYFVELARVHGVAFASEEAAPPPGAVEQALESLRRRLSRDLEAARADAESG